MDATVVIPTYNRAEAVVATLDALVTSNPGPGWEAVVVDDGSTDGTADIVWAWAHATGAPVRVLRQTNAGPAKARNAGAASARGRHLIFMDDDILVSTGFVTGHMAALAENPGCWIIGRVVLPEGMRDTPFGRYLDDLHERFHRGHPPNRPSTTEGMTACSLSLPAEDFRSLGGFDEDFTIASSEDWELGMRARTRGIRILYDPRIEAIHNDWAVDLDRFRHRQWLYSVSDVLLCHKYGPASPRWALVTSSGPLRLGREPFALSAKKLGKAVLATGTGHRAIDAACRLATKAAPGSALTSRTYDLAVGVAIFEGVREGIRRYGDPTVALRPVRRGAVLHLIDSSRSTGYFTSLARHADRVRHAVTIGSVAPPDGLQVAMEAAGVGTFSLNANRRWQYPLALIRLVRLLRAERPAVVHAHCFEPTVLGLVAARLTGTRFVFTRHHSDHNIRMGKRWHTRVDSWCARHADHVIAVSEATRRVLTGQEGVDSHRITVVHNGMEPIAAPPESERLDLKDSLGLDGGVPVCLMVARLHEEKGHGVLFDAIPDVTAAVGPVNWLLVGDGPDRARLASEVVRRRLDGVALLGQRTDIAALISVSDVAVQPSLAESFGFAALEASSLGRPVVVSDAGGLPEVVVDGVTGLVVPAGDSGALAEALRRVLKEPSWAAELGRAGQAWAKRFTGAQMVAGYEHVYDRLGP